MAYADSDSEAKKIFDSEAAHVTVSGTAVLVQSNGNDHGRVNLTVTVPQNGKGDGERGQRGRDRFRAGRGNRCDRRARGHSPRRDYGHR